MQKYININYLFVICIVHIMMYIICIMDLLIMLMIVLFM